MGEIDFYPELCEKFKNYLLSYLPDESKIAYSYNKTLPLMLSEIHQQLKEQIIIAEQYVPTLKLDILLAVKVPNKDVRLILFEVKYLNQLSLADFSQLVGYLQVAKGIEIGILLLVTKSPTKNALSNDFSDIVLMENLPMEWTLIVKEMEINNEYTFKVGICYYVPYNGIEWINTKKLAGISSFNALANLILSS